MVLTAAQLETMMPDATQIESDEPEMESSIHYMQLLLLVSCLEWLWRERNDYFIGANLTIYFSRQQLRNRDFWGPDFFLVQLTQKRSRKSWVVWEEEGQYPNLIVELLSTSTATVDRTVKKELYQNRFRTPEYFWFSPETLEFYGWRLSGHQYQAITPNNRGWRWSEELGLYLGVEAERLRYFTVDGVIVPTPEEAARSEMERAEMAEIQLERERQAKQLAQQEAARLAEKLRELGIEPEL
ncbi:MAG TPA: Uma2 family endonuclease [Oscillatoriales cyanobacterium M59_W2019_021]|nr:Uma2 family endonuclease [Oscillatoriales cyanobacterium M4454_W2019_049]HIK51051.1 Uma2 family endonuclease [Oscillatoriales cyanobacterium M59_W2019_021]